MQVVHWEISPIATKKYRVWIRVNGRLKKVDFGDMRYQHYRDTTPIRALTHLDHNDPERRRRYYQRHSTNYPDGSADYFSKKYLWE